MTGPALLDGGMLLVDKPAGCTSHDVVGRVRRVLGTRRVGHAGTLDPMATGLLLLGVGRTTKLLGRLQLAGKSYLATIRLGAATVTDDAEGEPVSTADPADLAAVDPAAVAAGLAALTGDILQRPSAVSAIKVDGVRSYRRVRDGEQVELPARPVRVDRFQQLGDLRPVPGGWDLDVEVDCSSGTYVRALARDLGAALRVGGHLTALRRTWVGPFRVADAVDVYGPSGPPSPGEHAAPPSPGLQATVRAALMAPDLVARRCFPVWVPTPEQVVALSHGRPVPDWPDAPSVETGQDVAAVADGRLIALVRVADGIVRPDLVFTPA